MINLIKRLLGYKQHQWNNDCRLHNCMVCGFVDRRDDWFVHSNDYDCPNKA